MTHSRWLTAFALLLLGAAVFATFPRAFSPDWVFFQRDIHAYWYPMVATFVKVVGQGQLPLWDPFEAYGLPLWADPGAQVAYPPTWLNLVLLPHTVYKVLVTGHALAGAIGTFALLRRFRMGLLPATVGAVAFACSGPFVSAGSLVHHLCGAAWIPWALWAFEGVLGTCSRRTWAVLSLVLAGQALAGSAEMSAMTGLLCLMRWIALLCEHRGRALRTLRPLAAAAGVAFLLASLQWIPSLLLLERSNRARFTSEMRLTWSVHPKVLVDLVLPRFLSEAPIGEAERALLFDAREPFLSSLYLGVSALPLVLLAVRSGRPQKRWVGFAFLFFLGTSLGRHFFAAEAVLSLPPLSLFRYPSKYLLPAALCWALLAALGTEVWWRAWLTSDRAYARAVGGCLAVGAILLAAAGQALAHDSRPLVERLMVAEPFRAWAAHLAVRKLWTAGALLGLSSGALLLRAWRPDWARPLIGLVAGLVATDLTMAARPVNALAPAALLAHSPPLLDSLQPVSEQPRLLSTSDSLRRLNQDLVRGPAGWEPEWRLALGTQEMIAAPLGTRWGLRGSYDADFTGLATPSLPFMSGLVRQTEASGLGVRLLQLGNVGWVIDSRSSGFPLLPEETRATSVFSNPLRLLRVPGMVPACYVVSAVSRADSDEAMVQRIASPEFDPWSEAVLAGKGEPRVASPGFRGGARYVLRTANHLRIETEANAPGLLVVVEAFDPDWRATVDGSPATVERANVLFRAVELPAGRHQVDLRYFPRSVAWGMGLAALGLVIVVAVMWPSTRAGDPAGTRFSRSS